MSFEAKSNAVRDALAEVSATGKFVRTASSYRNIISPDNTDGFNPAPGRYHLYISLACPWANRCLTVLKMKGLDDCIGYTVVHPTWQRTRSEVEEDTHCGWAFSYSDATTGLSPPLRSSSGCGSLSVKGCTPDTINGAKFIRDLYEMCDSSAKKFTVPVLWDKETGCIVNNESEDIVRMLTKEFDQWGRRESPFAEIDLYPSELQDQIRQTNAWIYSQINDGVYKCGFAQTQEAYDIAVKDLYEGLDRVESILSSSRYMIGNSLTEADIRLFHTLVRFDEVYVVYFKCNMRRISDYPNIRGYARELYQLPGVAESVDMQHIKVHYFTSHPKLNPYAVIPVGPNVLADLILPHDRERFN